MWSDRRDRVRAATVTVLLAACWLADRYLLPASLRNLRLTESWAAAIPWIISGISALASAYGQKKASASQDRAVGTQNQLIGQQIDQARQLQPYGQSFLQGAQAAYSPLLPYYTRLAAGDRSQLLQLLSPELAAVRQNYDVPLNQLSEVAPRTAATASGRLGMLGARANALSNTTMQGRMMGMTGLGALGKDMSSIGLGAAGASLGGLQGASQGNLGSLVALYGIRNQNFAESQALGSSLVDFYKQYQTWQAGRQPSGGATTTPSSTPIPAADWSTYHP